VIESVEEFCAELKVRSFRDRRVLMEGEGPILDSRAAANGTWRVTKNTWGCWVNKDVGIKVEAAVLARIYVMERKDLVRFAGKFERERVPK
jgi:hypothetical protein